MKVLTDKDYMGLLLKIFLITALTAACAPKKQKTPTALKVNLGSISVGAASEINCLAVGVQYPELVNNKSCLHNGITKTFHSAVGFSPRSGDINLNVTVGKDRKFILYGLKSTNGVCPGLGDNIMGDSNLSVPYYLGESAPTTIRPIASETVDITISFNPANEVDSCSGGFTYESVIGVWDTSTWDSAAVWAP
jgi:hypothetical protein